MFIQGNLQAVFDALYSIGAIDPILKMDWNDVTNEMEHRPDMVLEVVEKINGCEGSTEKLIEIFNQLDQKLIQFAALEVAREFCEFQERQTLH
ncbi:MAG: cytochrome [Pseudobdellovibrionaceae bacterium]